MFTRSRVALPPLTSVFLLLGGAASMAQTAVPVQQNPMDVDWRIPIHTEAADPIGGEYGWWAAGPSYKASFHDGFAFYPVLGTDYAENLPLCWTTESVTAGGVPIASEASPMTQAHADWRWEYRHAGVTEAYDVREDGVEQTFVIHDRPVGGDLVVTGRVGTELRLQARVAPGGAFGKLVFVDAVGTPIIDYGAAFAVDAAGRRTDVSTRFENGRIQLIVPATWLSAAVFPVTIDPLFSTGGFFSASMPHYQPAIGRDIESASLNVLFVVSRAVTIYDHDLYAFLTNDNLGGIYPIMTDLATSWSTSQGDCAFVAGADRWMISYQRTFTNPDTTRVRIYFHDKADTTLNSGQLAFHDPASNEADWYPRVGGNHRETSSHGLLVYQADPSYSVPTNVSVVYGALVDASTRTIGPRFRISPTGNFDCDNPDVNSASDNVKDTWVVAYEQLDHTFRNDDSDIYLARIRADGSIVGAFLVGPDQSTPAHKVVPQVEGTDGRYLVAMGRHVARGGDYSLDIATERVDWSNGDPVPTLHGSQVVVPQSPLGQLSHLRLAYDTNTRSHWVLVYQTAFAEINVMRFGFSGGLTEAAKVAVPSTVLIYAPAVSFDRDAGRFQIVHLERANGFNSVQGRLFTYPAKAISFPYGTGCGLGRISGSNDDHPYAGSEFFTVRIRAVPPGTTCVLLLAAAPGSIPVAGIGMPGCFLNLDLASVFLTESRVMVGTAAGVEVALPDRPLFVGDFHGQWVFTQPGLNPLGLGATQGLHVQVR